MSGKKTIAIIGNPNSGKTTLFNRLTGSNQHVGNWPGVTVDRNTGHVCHDGVGVDIVDLPGIYSLSPYTQEEIIAREYVLSDELDGILNIVDAANIERNLYLTLQLISLGLPMVVALGFMDDVRAQGVEINVKELERRLGVPVVPISAKKGENIHDRRSSRPICTAWARRSDRRPTCCGRCRCAHAVCRFTQPSCLRATRRCGPNMAGICRARCASGWTRSPRVCTATPIPRITRWCSRTRCTTT